MTTTAATARLNRALITLASQGLRTHCSDPGTSELWVSDHPGERAEAVRLCRGCPVLTVCRQTAEERVERWGVWGGRDFTRPPGKKKAA